MLEHLEITNYALIDNLSIDFSAGFNVITGETGAGKSIILGALGLLMGEKADSSSVRLGAREASINAVIGVPDGHEINSWLDERGMSAEDGAIVVRRTVRADTGRSSIYVQNHLVTRQELVVIADSLIDMHGQSEHQSLLHQDKQRRILDSFATDGEILEKCAQSHKTIGLLKARQDELRKMAEDGARQSDYLRFALGEIEDAKIEDCEDEQLKDRIARLAHFETIYESVQAACEKLNDAKSALRDASSMCMKASKYEPMLSDQVARMESSRIDSEDICESLKDYLSNVDYSENAINMLQDRQAQLQKLKRKYGPSLQDVMAFAVKAREELELADNSSVALQDCEIQIKGEQERYDAICAELTRKRKDSATMLSKRISDVLHTLGMPSAVFTIEVGVKEEGGMFGKDSIDFTICANQGEKTNLLKDVASGGELSRVMLALKTVLADGDSIQTQVFDEVDSGIGGSVALSLAECMKDLSCRKQVIAVTHLASIASKADTQFVVSKDVEDGRTFSHLNQVEGEDRVREIARMLSGDFDEATMEHARTMLKARS